MINEDRVSYHQLLYIYSSTQDMVESQILRAKSLQ